MNNDTINEVIAQEIFKQLYEKAVFGEIRVNDVQEIISNFFNVPEEKLSWIRY